MKHLKSTVVPGNVACSLVLAVLLFSGCRKDASLNGGGSGPSHLFLSVDSACIQAPNVFTPNRDGINDIFRVVQRNITDGRVVVLDPAGDTLFQTTDPSASWDGSNATSTGPFTVKVKATTTSGVLLQGQNFVHVLSYGNGNCLQFGGTPVSGDQFEARICGVSYPTNDVFCE